MDEGVWLKSPQNLNRSFLFYILKSLSTFSWVKQMPLKRSVSFSPILASDSSSECWPADNQTETFSLPRVCHNPVWLYSGQSSQTDHKVFINRDANVIWISYTNWLSATFFQILIFPDIHFSRKYTRNLKVGTLTTNFVIV